LNTGFSLLLIIMVFLKGLLWRGNPGHLTSSKDVFSSMSFPRHGDMGTCHLSKKSLGGKAQGGRGEGEVESDRPGGITDAEM
jgi:hypothetical protein